MLVTQNYPDFEKYKSRRDANAPFRYWLENVLKRSDRLPRGKFFRGKVGGKPIRIIDEFWLGIDKSFYFPQKPRYGLSIINNISDNNE
ncbi:MAG: hypothetical protein L0G48_08140 [Staphylococcus equorum]|nr:hypothetical protein [Acinetobacter sp.]MDN5638101.1 hypothetical protein [Staphylococcus equorum]